MGAKRFDNQNIVIDASVLIKWFTKENEDNDAIERMMEDFKYKRITINVPAVIMWEIGNWAGRICNKDVTYILSQIQMYGFMHADFDIRYAALACEIMRKHQKVSFYDASYHALALSRQAIFFTADKKYYEQTKKRGNIKLLKDYGKNNAIVY